MKVLMQRVLNAEVCVATHVVGAIGPGLLLFVGMEPQDDAAAITRMAERVLGYRVFSDDNGKMNLDVRDVAGDILVVSQFTLAADTRTGRRPSFSTAAPPAQAEQGFDAFVSALKTSGLTVATGQFAADMQVSSVNDGPVTFILQ